MATFHGSDKDAYTGKREVRYRSGKHAHEAWDDAAYREGYKAGSQKRAVLDLDSLSWLVDFGVIAAPGATSGDLTGKAVANLNENLAMYLLNDAMDRLAMVAQELSDIAAETAIAIAQIEAEGDRIDRLIAENQEMLDDLLAGKW